MKKYNISISSTTNLTSDDKFFLGTGFMGAEFSTMDDLKALLRKYATFEKDGKRYWRVEIKMPFLYNHLFKLLKRKVTDRLKKTE